MSKEEFGSLNVTKFRRIGSQFVRKSISARESLKGGRKRKLCAVPTSRIKCQKCPYICTAAALV